MLLDKDRHTETRGLSLRLVRAATFACLLAAFAVTPPAFFASAQSPQTSPDLQKTAGPIPKWDVVSIEPCNASSSAAPSATGRGRGNTPPASFSPLRMTLNCQSLTQYIQDAYLLFPNGQNPSNRLFALSTPIEGIPDWAKNEHYRIEATAVASSRPPMMEGPMLQAILEDRFKLKLHHETREVPVYDLAVAKGGPKLTPFVEGSCVPFPMDNAASTAPSEPQAPAGPKKYCRDGMGGRGGNYTIVADATTLDSFCKNFLNSVGDDHRRVIDKTGLTGTYSIQLEYSAGQADRDEMIARGGTPADPTAPEIFTAIQEQLGLKLVPDKGPGDFLVIDHIEEPSPN